MSLDVSLVIEQPVEKPAGSGIFIRENGRTMEISEAEWNKRNPGREPVRYQPQDDTANEVFEWNITHNLGLMAKKAGLYEALWRPDENKLEQAKDLIPILEDGLKTLKGLPVFFKQFNPDNGWGDYDGLVEFVENYLTACRQYPNARVEVSR